MLDFLKELIRSFASITRLAFVGSVVSLVLLVIPKQFYEEIEILSLYTNYKPYLWIILIISLSTFFASAGYDSRERLGALVSSAYVYLKRQTKLRRADPVVLQEDTFRRWEGFALRRGNEWEILDGVRVYCTIHNLELRLTTGFAGVQDSVCSMCRDAGQNYYGESDRNQNTDGVFYHHGHGYREAIDEIKRRMVQQRRTVIEVASPE